MFSFLLPTARPSFCERHSLLVFIKSITILRLLNDTLAILPLTHSRYDKDKVDPETTYELDRPATEVVGSEFKKKKDGVRQADLRSKIKIITIFSELDLTFLKVADGFVVVLQLQVTLAQEEMGLDRLAVQLQGSFAISQGLVMLLQLHMAQGPVGVVHCH